MRALARASTSLLLLASATALGSLAFGARAQQAAPPPSAPPSPSPGTAPAPAPAVVLIVSGNEHVCARRADGTVVCWGRSDRGALGGPASFDATPTLVPGIVDAVAMHASGERTCVYRRGGQATCWEPERPPAALPGTFAPGARFVHGLEYPVRTMFTRGPDARLEVDSFRERAPVFPDDLRVAEIAITEHRVCVREPSGQVRCVLKEDLERPDPPMSVVASGARSIAGRAWGLAVVDDAGRVRFLNDDEERAPSVIAGVEGAESVVLGAGFACARIAGGRVSCWGRNDAGQLGRGFVTRSVDVREPAAIIPDLEGVVELVAGNDHACARRATGPVLCWGHLPVGAYRYGDIVRMWEDDRPRSWVRDDTRALHAAAPTQVPGLTNATAVVATRDNSCALLGDGRVACWGGNLHGQNGDGTRAVRPSPVMASGITDAVEIAATCRQVCVRRRGGRVACWGRAFDAATPVPAPVEVAGLEDTQGLLGSLSAMCARRADGSLWCWGAAPMLPRGGTATPTAIDDLRDARTVSFASNSVYFVRADGTAVWRRQAPRGGALTDAPVAELTGATSIAVGHDHSCAITADAHVTCWGANGRGQLGLGDLTERTGLTPVANLEQATAVVNGDDFGCAIHRGGVTCWGDNSYGQLGRNIRRDSRPTAVNVASPLTSHVVSVAAGSNHICAVKREGTVWCWGDGTHGTLGDGRASYRTEPTPVDLTLPAVAAPAAPPP